MCFFLVFPTSRLLLVVEMTLLILQRFTADLRTLIVTVASLRRRLLCYLTLCVSCSSSPLPLFSSFTSRRPTRSAAGCKGQMCAASCLGRGCAAGCSGVRCDTGKASSFVRGVCALCVLQLICWFSHSQSLH